MEHSKHLARMILLVVLILVVFHIVRTLFTPQSFGKYGHYRADNVAEQMAKPVAHGGAASCEACHAERYAQVKSGAHATVECESCHAPLAGHVAEGKRVAAMLQNRSASLCLRCHDRLDARPERFPQIQVEEHLGKMGATMGPEVCVGCHDSHDPKMGR